MLFLEVPNSGGNFWTHFMFNKRQNFDKTRRFDQTSEFPLTGAGEAPPAAGAVHFSEHDTVRQSRSVQEISRVTWVGVAVNIGLALGKGAAGYWAGSKALIADAVHTLSDLATDCAILVGVRYWSAPADDRHPHGHGKIETLVTLGIGLALAAVGLALGYEAVAYLAEVYARKIIPTATESLNGASLTALAVALVSIVSKELLYRWTARQGARLGSPAIVANAWHHRSDAFSSIPPLAALGGELIGGRFGYNLWYLDPLGTLVVCVMLLQAAWHVMEPTLGTLLDASADRRLCSTIRRTVLETPGVISTHCVRTRVIGGNAVAVDLHIAVDRNLSVAKGHAIAADVKYRLLGLGGSLGACPVDVLVHVEPGDLEERRVAFGGQDQELEGQ